MKKILSLSLSPQASKKIPLIALAAIILGFPAVSFAQVATTTATSTVMVTINKLIDGQPATATSANSTDFPMSASWNATNLGTGTGQFALSAGGFGGDPTPYQAITGAMTSGAQYSVGELTNGAQVGPNCAAGKPFALVGYTTGDTYPGAASGTPTTTAPTFTNLTNNKNVIVWNTKCPITSTTTPPTTTATGSLQIMHTIVGGTATQTDFQIHVKRAGTDITGSPFAALSTGFVLNGLLATGTYVLSDTGPANYQTTFIGDCSTSGSIAVATSTTRTCTLTDTFTGTTTPTTTPTFLKVHILKYLDGSVATASSSGGYLFPMSATWQTANLNGGSTTSGTFTLGNNFGQAADLYGADTASMQSPASYTTAEVTTGTSKVLPIGSACSDGMYHLKGYTSSNASFANAATQTPVSTTAPNFSNLTADKFVIVWNESCGSTTPTTTPPVVSSTTPQGEKQSILNALIALRMSTTHNPSWDSDDRKDRFHRGHSKLLDDAIINLRASLKPSLWIDGTHLSSTNGDVVFDREQDVVDDLMQLIAQRKNTIDDATLQGYIDRLLAADRALAATAIADAVAANGTPQNITKANTALARGDTALANERILRAMWRYQQAWGFAITSH